MHQHYKKDEVTWVTVAAQPADVVRVYVDAAGNPTATVTGDGNPTPAPAAQNNNQGPPQNQGPPNQEPPPAAPPAQPAQTTGSPAPSPSPQEPTTETPSSGGGSGFGFTYSPYNPDHSVKSSDQMKKDFDSIKGEGFSVVRIYGVDNHQTKLVLEQAKAHGMKLFAAVFDLSQLENDLNTLIADVGGDWGSVDTVSIGNELVNEGKASPDQVVAAIGTAKEKLKAAGWSSPVVVTTDTLVATNTDNGIKMCDASTYCAVNCHPFFDPNTSAEGAGQFIKDQMANLRKKLANPNQRIVISETGWPWQGLPNQKAVPSESNQQKAIQTIKDAFSSNPADVFLFNTFNTMWKKNSPQQFEAEQYWGFLKGSGGAHGTAPSEANESRVSASSALSSSAHL
ncbi:putative family 17 glucosidase SCW10 [Glarea lozoyensis 74030]|uniref:Putative family 17 glucosidase SCW10 n=1 Tax=Glarea lozoyensis (strain ATCC 74030 / MF5533) TaxID=1104152 RepID=H0ETW7_GLAL7|nr:putative family 17 glucosidase SCW10 [Glarea lozoyensis 74030]